MKFHFPLIAIALASSLNANAENWAQWRGPAFNGTSPEANLPSNWSATEGVKWSTPLPGISGATPAIWEDSIFVSSPDANKNLLLFCLDRKDGKVRWQKQVATGNIDKGRGNMASPSPLTDGKTVYAFYGTGDLAAFDFNGNALWQRNLGADYGRFAIMWTYGSSPLLFEGKLYIQVLQRSPAPPDYPGLDGSAGDRESYLIALDPATGKTLWKALRSSEAKLESQESYASPVPHRTPDGKTQILLVGGDCMTGHDPATGAELWRGYGINRKGGEWMRVVASPVSAAGLAIASGPKKEPLIAFRTDLKGDISQSGVAWSFDEKKTPDVCTPVFYDGKLFVLDGDSQTLTCLDPKSGAKKWQGNLGDRMVIRSSPTAADGKIYIINEKGTVFVCSAGDEFKLLATIPMGGSEGTRSSIAISNGQLFIRTTNALHCIQGGLQTVDSGQKSAN
ncbi:MAG: Pyrrolo-quinoline quinone [Chthoniobacteraceae bacterium]|nr:Pyrrolo-quinoline quinone [Chthoniobacteraceae bacterium]